MGRGEWPQGPKGGGGRRRVGGGKMEGWNGGSDATSDAETEEYGWDHAPLTASPWSTQESGRRGLRVDARAGGSDGRKVPSATGEEAEMRGRHGVRREQGAKKGGWRGWERVEPLGVGGNFWGREASGVDPEPHGVEGEKGGHKASGVEENPGGGRQGVGGEGSNCLVTTRPATETAGGSNSPRTT